VQDKKDNGSSLIWAILGSMLLWGLSWPSGKVLTHFSSPINLSAYRYIVVFITMVLLLAVMRVPMRISRAGLLPVALSGGMLAVYSFLSFKGLQTGTPGAGGVLVTIMNPIMAYALGLIIGRRRPSANETLGLALGAVAGAVLLKAWDNTASLLDSGNIYFLLAAFTWAAMSKITSRGSRYGSSLSFSLWQYLVTLVILLPVMDMQEGRAVFAIDNFHFWLNLFFGSAIVTSIATTIYFYATTRLGAERASSFIFMVPLAATVSSWVFLGEHIKPHTAAGGLMGIAAVYIINRKKPVAEKATMRVAEEETAL
jgi:drug/metabolite transporter (DMT)-like permease